MDTQGSEAPADLTPLPAPLIIPVLLAGGTGTRLWPLSRETYPKQFLRLTDDRSLMQHAALRARAVAGDAPLVVLGSEAHRFVIAEQLLQLEIDNAIVLVEPEGRNTGPAAAVAARMIADRFGPEAIMFLMAADQSIADDAAFEAAARTAIRAAWQGRMVIFGIQPTSPETGFGWMHAGASTRGLTGIKADTVRDVETFVEKPSLDRAEEFLREGNWYWNGGMFVFRTDVLLEEFRRLEPLMLEGATEALESGEKQRDFWFLDADAFRKCPRESISVAIMERSRNISLVPLDAGWDDVGSWSFLGKLPTTDTDGNHVHGDVLLEDSRDNLVHATWRLVTLVGVESQVVVETNDSILITSRDRVQDVRKIVQRLKKEGRVEAERRPRVYRPWGYYETIALGPRFQVKRVKVKSGEKLSLQMHHHRAEHWIVVTGTARVTCEDKVFLLTEDQSTYIPLGHKHRLENPGRFPLELIEVQSGAYLDEDDIVRFEDVYGRVLG